MIPILSLEFVLTTPDDTRPQTKDIITSWQNHTNRDLRQFENLNIDQIKNFLNLEKDLLSKSVDISLTEEQKGIIIEHKLNIFIKDNFSFSFDEVRVPNLCQTIEFLKNVSPPLQVKNNILEDIYKIHEIACNYHEIFTGELKFEDLTKENFLKLKEKLQIAEISLENLKTNTFDNLLDGIPNTPHKFDWVRRLSHPVLECPLPIDSYAYPKNEWFLLYYYELFFLKFSIKNHEHLSFVIEKISEICS